jgi:diaminohydroxyphosphoribosylaminopyrimidine deaminase/5-amino-6-(5-phosphoribosylamino)uracil reductase
MTRAIAAAARVRCITSPNPWVGAVLRTADGEIFEGATREPGRRTPRSSRSRGGRRRAPAPRSTSRSSPAPHRPHRTVRRRPHRRGRARVVVGIEDPDPRVAGSGIAAAARRRHRGRRRRPRRPVRTSSRRTSSTAPRAVPGSCSSWPPRSTGGTAAPDGSSQWITGAAARADGHRLRAESDAIVVGAGTVRRDDPSLTVRDYHPPVLPESGSVDPMRVVLGTAPPTAKVQPCPRCGRSARGARRARRRRRAAGARRGWRPVAGDFHRAGLVDRYVIYVAPALFGGDDAWPVHRAGAWDIDDLWRGRFETVERVGDDLRIELSPGLRRRPRTPPRRRPDVHRHRRGAGHGRVARGPTSAHARHHRARRRVAGRLDRGQRLLPDRRRLGRRLVGGRRLRRDLRPHRLGDLAPGDPVNLERPVRLEDRLGGHLVQGHVDAVGEITAPAPDLRSACPAALRYIVEKGSITVDGCQPDRRRRARRRVHRRVIPHTAEVTTLGRKGVPATRSTSRST